MALDRNYFVKHQLSDQGCHVIVPSLPFVPDGWLRRLVTRSRAQRLPKRYSLRKAILLKLLGFGPSGQHPGFDWLRQLMLA